MKIEGMERLLGQLNDLDKNLQNKALRPAITSACRYVAKVAKTYAPVESGLLKQNIGQKVKAYGPGKIVGLVGAESTDGTWKGKPRNPAHYFHLVEMGHGGQHGPASPHPMLRPALDSSAGEVQNILVQKCQEHIERLGR